MVNEEKEGAVPQEGEAAAAEPAGTAEAGAAPASVAAEPVATPPEPQPAEPQIPRAATVIQADQRPAIAAEHRAVADGGEVSRRRAIQGGFWTGLGITVLGLLGVTLKFVWPENVKGFGGTFVVNPDRLPKKGGDPVRILEAKTWLVNLAPGEGIFGDLGEPNPTGGLLALFQKCPHLGCTVPWLPGFDYSGQKGWFRCPCHQSTYTRAGIRVFGPAPRPMDTFDISFDSQGRLVINTGKITLGDVNNPSRALPTSF